MAYVATDRISKQRGWVARLWSALGKWRALRVRRQAFLNTRRLDDRMLADIGVTREEVEWAAGLPLEMNASEAMYAAAAKRRAEEGAKMAKRR